MKKDNKKLYEKMEENKILHVEDNKILSENNKILNEKIEENKILHEKDNKILSEKMDELTSMMKQMMSS